MNLSSKLKRFRRSSRQQLCLLAAIGLLSVLGNAQANSSPAPSFFNNQSSLQDGKDELILDFLPELWNKDQKTPVLSMISIDPPQGPSTGETRVLVRGGPFSKWQNKYLHPVCKFGDKVVTAQYVTCPQNQTSIYEKEFRGRFQGYRCIQCENSPKVDYPQTVAFSVSLTGDFSDCDNKMQFEYYPPTRIEKIYPRYGPKDGDTPVQVFGQHFKEFGGEGAMCGFGTRTTKATVFNDTYLECHSPVSDIVEKPIPFTISLNKQQNSRDNVFFWYYNWPTIEQLVPNRGPEDGGTVITLHGRNFFPFKDYPDEINNAEDVFCAFIDLNKRTRATVTNSTTATCVAPPADTHKQTRVEITLNGVEYTMDENIFYYYKPPNLFDVTPRMGPVKGGTKLKVIGSNFLDTGEIKCDFLWDQVPGTYISDSEIECVSPPADKAGYVNMRIALRKNLWSSPIKYLYYDAPQIVSAGPTCGPETGYTQIEVTGKNFVDLGRNTALCIFNQTIYTNATVFSDTQLFCDSPAFTDDQGIPLLGKNGVLGNFYDVKVTIDGGREMSPQSFRFNYYRQPHIVSTSPSLGPIEGGTVIQINATDVNQIERCGLTIRLGADEYTPKKLENGLLELTTNAVNYPGPVTVEVSYNDQQFSKKPVAHYKDPKSTFWYYSQPMIAYHHPNSGPWTGATPVAIDGIGFKPFEDDDVTGLENKIYIRYANIADPHGPLVEDQLLIKDQFTNEQIFLSTPSQPPGQKALIQLSFNKQNWLTVKSPKLDYSFTWYDSPHVTKVDPPFGPVKNPKPLLITVTGKNFVCPDTSCKSIRCRFGEPPHSAIYVDGSLTSDGKIQCLAPVYVQPDILRLEVTLNEFDYSHDNKTFGYFDPYVIDAQPRLLNVDGSTKVTIKGIGFVDSGETKAMFANPNNPLQSTDGVIKNAEFIDKNYLKTTTLPQSKLIYSSTGKSVMWDGFYIEASVYNDEFTDNRITLYYYEEPLYTLSSDQTETPANIPSECFIDVKANPRDVQNLLKYGDFKCRFQSARTTIIVNAEFLHTPLIEGADEHTGGEPNTMYCKSPIWPIDESVSSETVKLDISVNGQHYSGGLDFTFTRKLVLHRDVPMSGPFEGFTNTLLIGQSFRSLKSTREYSAKWGPISTDVMRRNEVNDYSYTLDGYLNTIPGGEEISAYWNEAAQFQRVDTSMDSSHQYTSVRKSSPQIAGARPLGFNQTYTTHYGGPWFVEVGREVTISTETNLEGNNTSFKNFQYHDYLQSSVEFYEYKRETVVAIRPTRVLSKGGSAVEVVGYDFRYMPEYGVVPHCKFGDKIVRARFDSTVRLVCNAPANDDITTIFPFEVSMNGVDWSSSGLTFSYYEEPILNDVFPDAGDSRGGSDVYFIGQKFTNITDSKEFNCRFTPTTIKAQPKIMPAVFLNSTHITCKTPGGWSKGDKMMLQITFNGIDYDTHGFTFIFYHIAGIFPRSGPSNGLGGDIIVSGEGFRPENVPKCRLNKIVSEPLSVAWNEIRCPMLAHPSGPTFFGTVDLAVTANGQDWNEFEDGFQYYEQPIVTDIYPKQGPASGIGIVNFYGTGFRADFGLVNLGCKIGKSEGKAFFVSKNQLSCVVEDMETVPEGERLPARVALNAYSWTETNDNEETGSTFFVPYSVTVIYPQDGPITGSTDILIQGTGFLENDQLPRCRFGTKSNYVIVEAEIISYYRLTCTTPAGFVQKEPVQYPTDVPFSVALLADSFEPWTDTGHKFRFFKQPIISKVEPNEIEVGSITQVFVSIDQQETGSSNIFFEPIPAAMQQFNHNSGEDVGPTLAQFSYIICGWGRFGETRAIYVNQTHIKCTTPAVPDDPMDISREPVNFQVSMNGFDFEDANGLQFSFVGKASGSGMIMYFIMTLLLGLLAAAIIYATKRYYDSLPQPQ